MGKAYPSRNCSQSGSNTGFGGAVRRFPPRGDLSGEDAFHEAAVDVGQPEIASLVAVGEAFAPVIRRVDDATRHAQ